LSGLCRTLFGAILVAALLGGCATVPDASSLKSGAVGQAPEFKTAWGMVSERAAAALAARLKQAHGDVDLLDRQIAIEQAVASTPLVLENRVTLLIDGPATYRAMFSAMRAAQRTINIEFYIIQDDPVGQEFAEIILERRAAGVQVNLVYDSLGSFKTKQEYFDRLRTAGVQVVAFNPVGKVLPRKPWKLNHRDHRKQVIVDGRTVFLGGINIDDVYAESSDRSGSAGSSGGSGGSSKDQKRRGWRDTAVQIDGPVVAEFQKLFLQTWERQKGPALRAEDYLPQLAPAGKMIVRAFGSSPDDPTNPSYLTFIAALTHAQKQAYITNAYFVPDPQLLEALKEAAGRGVDVRLILPSTTDSRAAAYSAHSHYTELLRAGVRIFERQSALLHAKTAVIDRVWSRVGSSNLDWRSAVDNDELDAVIIGREFGDAMLRAHAEDEAQSREIRLEAWLRRPWRDRFQEWFFHAIGRLL
jgi:cardiolipin synthase